jgi:4-hydroxybenzoate polyprenyltransferase
MTAQASPSTAFAYFLHLRPKSWPTLFAHAFAGAMMAKGPDLFKSTETHTLIQALVGSIVWAVCLNGGTLAFNSAIDKDDGDVGFLNNPPPIPKHLAAFGFGLMLIGCVAGFFISLSYLLAYVVCVVLSWLYSAPPARLKTRGGWDVAVNMIGYGALTLLAGWFAVVPNPDGVAWFVALGFACLFGVVYPMTQFYQREEDERKGARTLALMLGKHGSMIFIHVSLILALLSWGWALNLQMVRSPYVSDQALYFAAVPGVIWLIFCLDWWIRFDRYPHQKGLYRSMALWAITDILLVITFGRFDALWG